MLTANVDVNLPQANARSLKDKQDPGIISVGADGKLFLTLGDAKKEPIDEEALKAKVGAFVKANPEVSVLVAGDRDGKYDGVYQVLADLQQAGVAKVGLMSQPPQGTSASDGRK
jgi:biopolymer transport protein TolR